MQEIPSGEARLQIQTVSDGEFLRVDVSDNGRGIPTEKIPRIFGPFFTTKPTGLGLGLSISRSIVENHRGQLTVVSKPGNGTTFSFTLPIQLR
jgi:signal transduction histidine kinase